MTAQQIYPNEWVACTLGEVVETIRGVSYVKEQAASGPKEGYLPILRATNIDRKIFFEDFVFVPSALVSSEQLLKLGDVVIAASSGSKNIVGKAAQLSQDWKGSFGAFCMGIRPTSEIEPRFVGHFLQSDEYRHRVSKLAAGSNINNLKREHIELFPFRLAPLQEQRRISNKVEELLSDLDVGVAALERARAKLKRYRAAVLKAAVEGRLTAEWRKAHPLPAPGRARQAGDVEPASKLLERILAERRRKWEEIQLARLRERNARGQAKYVAQGKNPPKGSKNKYPEPAKPDTLDLPELPEGWCSVTVDQVSELKRYGSSAKTSEDVVGVPVLRMGNIQDGRLDLAQLKYLPADHREFPDLLLAKGELLFNRTNSAELVGKTAVYKGLPEPCSFASYLIGVRLLDGCAPEYLSHFINSVHGRNWIGSVVSQQVGQANVNGMKLAALSFPLPPQKEQEAIVSFVEERVSIMENVVAELARNQDRASRLRQSILKRAFEGKLVPQDPSDEPASVLLERIRAARAAQNPPRAQKRRRVPA